MAKNNEKFDKVNFELEKQKFYYKYWFDGEKSELTILSIVLASMIIPTINSASQSNANIPNIVYFIIFIIIVIFGLRFNYYRKNQKIIKEKIDKMKV